ncbi:uncharacterized protein EDB93DRAFT_1257065 [Suillus bovinus]|uniref:uncharacterized protein n=1 Tax=Suillus bovinus TaxID=48563 RepID=UPI001B8607B4|nr:uncharacterized protein EDB93DRAFT_1257065 [Suillus bovinus]KAG2127312.1 hypothetical protein EDB93DRAFT_1257065 [Suillus bovinus]
MVDILQFAELVEPCRRSLDPLSSQFPLDHDRVSYDPDPGDGMDFGIGGDHFDTAGEEPSSAEEWYEGAGTCYSQDGTTFLDIFNADEFANSNYLSTMLKNYEAVPRCSPRDQAGNRDPVECLESLFSNPLFHDKLDFVPRRVYTTAAQVLHVYLEWLMGDFAWDIQNQLPRGATILGTVLSSDKTNITTMTGARVAHPLLLGLANIRMCTRTKLSSGAFLLTALLPIPQYLHPNQQMRGMLEDRLIHECLVIVLKPLMIAAEIGIMMSDPVGNICHCYMPLAAYIVDTPEACMLTWQNFSIHHGIISQLVNIKADPNKLKAFFEACTEYWLNGVHTPFWMYWLYADPSVFLTLESLHHWHNKFWDHNLHWCLVAVGALELDFRFSILQPITGYRHFSCGILKLKQVTARVHCDVQCYIIGLIAGTAPRHFVTAICALMDVQYMAQSPSPDDDLLTSIDQSLLIYHQNKDLELMQSITASMRKVGALIQWSADATKHAHISEIKDPTRHTNNNDYDPQICHHLDRLEKLWRFEIATMLKSHVVDPGTETEDEGGEEEGTACDEEEPTDP